MKHMLCLACISLGASALFAAAPASTVLYEETFEYEDGWGMPGWWGGTGALAGQAEKPTLGPIKVEEKDSSRAFAITADFSGSAGDYWGAFIYTRQRVEITNTVNDLTRLRLRFKARGSQTGRISIELNSYAAAAGGKPVGTLKGMVYLDAADKFQEFVVTLNQFKAPAGLVFDATAGYLTVGFEIRNDWGNAAVNQLVVDDIVYEVLPVAPAK